MLIVGSKEWADVMSDGDAIAGLMRDYQKECEADPDMCYGCNFCFFCESGYTPRKIAETLEKMAGGTVEAAPY